MQSTYSFKFAFSQYLKNGEYFKQATQDYVDRMRLHLWTKLYQTSKSYCMTKLPIFLNFIDTSINFEEHLRSVHSRQDRRPRVGRICDKTRMHYAVHSRARGVGRASAARLPQCGRLCVLTITCTLRLIYTSSLAHSNTNLHLLLQQLNIIFTK